jgi:hypothetical protein
MLQLLCLLASVLISAPPVWELRNGHWLTPSGFQQRTMYVVDGRLTLQRPVRIDSIIDLQHGYVTPPFGEAHNHNVDYSGPARTDSMIARYRRAGVFYVKVPGILARGRDSVRSRLHQPGSIDAIFALGLLTSTGGHPSGLWKRNVERGAMTAEDGDGGFLWLIDTQYDLQRKWPRILAQRPDFIKTVLVHSEEYDKRRQDSAYFNWRGLNPALLPEIVQRAHAAGLSVSTHVETAADFHAAVAAGVNEINHIPGFRGNEQMQIPEPRRFQISRADARMAAAKNIVVVTTLGGIGFVLPTGADSLRRRAFDNLARYNLRVLRDAGVRLVIGSDTYGDNSSQEVAYLRGLGVFTDLDLLRLWSESTPRAIFPNRRIGCLQEGCEASFQVFAADPSVDLQNVQAVRLRMKDGHRDQQSAIGPISPRTEAATN